MHITNLDHWVKLVDQSRAKHFSGAIRFLPSIHTRFIHNPCLDSPCIYRRVQFSYQYGSSHWWSMLWNQNFAGCWCCTCDQCYWLCLLQMLHLWPNLSTQLVRDCQLNSRPMLLAMSVAVVVGPKFYRVQMLHLRANSLTQLTRDCQWNAQHLRRYAKFLHQSKTKHL